MKGRKFSKRNSYSRSQRRGHHRTGGKKHKTRRLKHYALVSRGGTRL